MQSCYISPFLPLPSSYNTPTPSPGPCRVREWQLLTTYFATDRGGDSGPGRREEGRRVFESRQKLSKSNGNVRKKFYKSVQIQVVCP